MPRNLRVGIDLGSENTRIVVAEIGKGDKGEKNPKIIGAGEVKSRGIRHGYVVDLDLAEKSLRQALELAETSSGVKIKSAVVGLSGVSLRADAASGIAMVGKADGEVTSLDIKKAQTDAEENLKIGNRKIVHLFPTSFRLDGKEVLGRVEGMRGTKLETKAIFVTYSSQHLEDLLDTVALAKVESSDAVATAVAASTLVLSEREKIVGVALLDIGAEKTTVAVFENGTLVSLYSFGLGGADITNDIALGFKTSLDTAEKVKLGDLPPEFSRKKLEEIVEARMADIFELVGNHLKKIKRSELLPAGAVFVGGGALTGGLIEFSKSTLKLPSRIGSTEIFGSTKTRLRSPEWLGALGLIHSEGDANFLSDGSGFGVLREIKKGILSGLRQLMP